VLARAVGLARRTGVTIPLAFRAARAGNVFTTHTPISAAFDEFDPAMLTHYAMPFLKTVALPAERLLALGRSDPQNAAEPFNMAFLAMRGCCHVNAVSQLHGRVSQRLFSTIYAGWPETEVPIGAITNGVHIPTWNSAPARDIWVSHSQDNGWFEDLSSPASALNHVDPTRLWNMRANVRQTLVEYVRTRLQRQLQVQGESESVVREAGHVLDPNVLTLGFARRFTEYKRPTLLLHDTARFMRLLLDPARPVQLIVAGKAHPNDGYGKQLVRTMARFAMRPELRNRVVFIEDYDMVLAQHLAGGIDVWLNTPRRPAEACGTSGMKMLFNGGLHLSVRDGWWDEAWNPSVGWAIGDGLEDDAATRDIREAEQLYEVLEQEVIPEFYDRDNDGVPHRWLERVYASMSGLTPQFSSHRMVKDYVRLAYCPAAGAIDRRIKDDARIAHELYEWHLQLEEKWRDLRFGELRVSDSDDHWKFTVDVYLGDLAPDCVRVELYADSLGEGGARP
ncbi:MAG: alpha-glucan family phosphorylase, partial [Planctomycetaceae bacterium]